MDTTDANSLATPAPTTPAPTVQLPHIGLAVLTGLLTALAHPLVLKPLGPGLVDPTGYSGLLIFVGYIPVLWAIRDLAPWRALVVAWVAFFVHFVGVAHWLVVALSHFGGLPFVAGVLGMLIICGLVAAFVAAAFFVVRLLDETFGWKPHWVFPIALCAAEFARAQMPFGGAPWTTAGLALAPIDVLRQGAALVGVSGLAAVVGLVNAALYAVLDFRARQPHDDNAKFPVRTVATAVVVFVGLLVYGGVRLSENAEKPRDTLKVAMLQASIPQDVLNAVAGNAQQARENRAKILAVYHQLQKDALLRDVELVIWPEAALRPGAKADATELTGYGTVSHDDWSEGRANPEHLATVTPKAAIVGSVAIYPKGLDARGRQLSGFYTSAFATEENYKVVGRWDKRHLLPFGEITPWPLGAIVSALVHVGGILTPGTETPVRDLKVGDRVVKIGTTICYEGVFSEFGRDFAADGAQLHVNLTNDAWYGTSSEMEQHWVHYAMRATESGVPVVRAANSGISGWFDAKGREMKRTQRDEVGAVLVDIPLPTKPLPTLYVVIGDIPALLALLFALLATLLASLVKAGGRQVVDDNTPLENAVLVLALLSVPVGLSLLSFFALDEGLYTVGETSALWGLMAVMLLRTTHVWGRRLRTAAHVVMLLLAGLAVATLHVGAIVAVLGPLAGVVTTVLARLRAAAEAEQAEGPVPHFATAAPETPEQDDASVSGAGEAVDVPDGDTDDI